jgi:hypothetical protein
MPENYVKRKLKNSYILVIALLSIMTKNPLELYNDVNEALYAWGRL